MGQVGVNVETIEITPRPAKLRGMKHTAAWFAVLAFCPAIASCSSPVEPEAKTSAGADAGTPPASTVPAEGAEGTSEPPAGAEGSEGSAEPIEGPGGAPAADSGVPGDGPAPTDGGAPEPPDTGDAATTAEDAGQPPEGAEGGPFPTPVADDCITDVSAGEHEFMCDGYKFDVSVPEQCLTQACGLIADVHGLGGTAEMADNNTLMRERGREHGYIVIQPNANPGPPTGGWYPDDYDAVWSFYERTARVFNVDPRKWHFMGFSQGGRMTWNMLCAHADKLASVVPAAYGMDPKDPCSAKGGQVPVAEIPVFYMHGTRDAVRPFSEGIEQRDNLIADWAMHEDGIVAQDDAQIRTRYTNANGTIFEFWQHDYEAESTLLVGHCVPGSPDLKGGEPMQFMGFACLDKNTPAWAGEAMNFFLAHPRE